MTDAGTPYRSASLLALVRLSVGPAIYMAYLAVIYIGHTLACRIFEPNLLSTGVRLCFAVATGLALIMLGLAMVASSRDLRPRQSAMTSAARRFFPRAALALELLSCIAVLWTGAVIMLLPACTG